MTPEYLYELADLADPDQLWRGSVFKQLDLPPEKRRQLDTGVALRRHATDIQRMIDLYGTGQSLLLTPLSEGGNSRDIRTVDTPKEISTRFRKGKS